MGTPDTQAAGTADASAREGRPVIFIAVAMVVAIMMNAGYTTWLVQSSQHRWCATIGTLNDAAHGAPPPATSYGRHLESDFRDLYSSLGCG